MTDFYKNRVNFLHEFYNYLYINLGETAAVLWWSVLENNHPKHYENVLLYWTAIDERAWHDAVVAFANLTKDIREVSF